MKQFLTIVAIAFLVLSFVVALKYGFEKQEVVDCLKLQGQSEEFKESQVFFITEYEKAQCDAHNININAPIGDPQK